MGGGVDNAASGLLTLERCLIISNTAPRGAGLMLQGTKTNQVVDTVFRMNYGADETCLLYGSGYAVFERCDFIDNSKRALAGDYAPMVTNCTFIGNQGGGINLAYASDIVDCTFISNRVTGSGGGILLAANQTVDRCILFHNFASASGGGIHMGGGTVRNALIVGNESAIGGGIRVISSAIGRIENCTIVGNKGTDASYGCGGIFFQSLGAEVTNSICLYNLGSTSSISNYQALSAPMRFGYSCTAPAPSGGVDGGSNVTANPLFVDPGSGFGTNYVLGDLTLQSESPCKNAGLELAWMTGALDLAGAARIAQGGVDMGAYEFVQDTPLGIMVQVQ